MKRAVWIVWIGMMVGVSFADLAISWKSQAGAVEATNGANDFLEGSRIDLIFSEAGAVTAPGPYYPWDLNEIILATGTTGANSLWNEPGQVFSGDFTGGFFFTRIYETDGSFFEYFLDIPMGHGADWVYNPMDTHTVYADNVVSGILWVGENGVALIPEPATVSLMGIAAMGLFMMRSRSRR